MKICEIFPSIQGESSLVGVPMVFIRFTGCNLRCTYCDTKYAYDNGTELSKDEILQIIHDLPFKFVEITGGEPLLQEDVYPLIDELVKNYYVLLETNGSVSIEKVNRKVKIIMDIKTPGSGMCDKNYLDNLTYLKEFDEIKFVLTDKFDYEWAKEFLKIYKLKTKEILFSPAFGMLNATELAQWIIKDGLSVRLNLQIHKYISIK
ncbi:MAG: radical SAM protein [Thermodesulfovibrio sp.]|uniref:radical SAM protein n=1 Tax=unclassified Thermodesulfovibrio TaxID=2645936 RepID=UPI00083A8C7E|nr:MULTISPECIES: radical SAM protein [unclassified Thermodesulfovibrio]MDI1471015.1 radical SAM protein [Thermodesulfovibrio sp. 1176]MDI6713865.1 radical SAM protein [Thermodesulfovibrio sp.]ODA43423.1 Queuosine Biosynthesis QueE Radical SAM [Thermodesulfovibrio sp. N1]